MKIYVNCAMKEPVFGMEIQTKTQEVEATTELLQRAMRYMFKGDNWRDAVIHLSEYESYECVCHMCIYIASEADREDGYVTYRVESINSARSGVSTTGNKTVSRRKATEYCKKVIENGFNEKC